ncbi:MAG TPA: alkaline phosphatase family protein [Candidatus Micrarchaeia archaeon]|nr:alkaline phosphatase family protein [Candidatus Micrarchaeia archaeon]
MDRSHRSAGAGVGWGSAPAEFAWPHPSVPRYGERSLADLVPSLLAALGTRGMRGPIALEPARRVLLLVIDGLGEALLDRHADDAPFLATHRREPLTCGFPSTTAASLGSIGTGLAPGEHGLPGYTIQLPGQERALNVLRWEWYGRGATADLRDRFPPETLQPEPTAFERARDAGVGVTMVGTGTFAHSGLTRAVLRGGRWVAAHGLADVVMEAARAIAAPGPRLLYAYHPELDGVGHVRGVASDAWHLHLRLVDRAVEALAARLPDDCRLVVTGDHGMVDIPEAGKVDLDDEPALRQGVRLLAGEPRARHVHVDPGAEADVLAAWRERLGHAMWVVTRDEAIEAGWFGPRTLDRVRPRIGDIVAAAFAAVGVVQRTADGPLARLIGHHGSLTADEQVVPYIVV